MYGMRASSFTFLLGFKFDLFALRFERYVHGL